MSGSVFKLEPSVSLQLRRLHVLNESILEGQAEIESLAADLSELLKARRFLENEVSSLKRSNEKLTLQKDGFETQIFKLFEKQLSLKTALQNARQRKSELEEQMQNLTHLSCETIEKVAELSNLLGKTKDSIAQFENDNLNLKTEIEQAKNAILLCDAQMNP
eukprot:GCRY01002849.1.p1 GENE.GCRY01002849.1~~GCRY01002849.1.p1  ORF type:complete len:162 (+),score=29.05 GCRY01002849.1:318-803(+)